MLLKLIIYLVFLFVCHSVSSPKVGLLFVILSVIFMKGGVVRESEFKKKKIQKTPTKYQSFHFYLFNFCLQTSSGTL